MSEIANLLFEKALTAIRASDYNRAAKMLQQVLIIDPAFKEAWVVRGNVLDAVEHSFDALLHYDRALDLDPNLSDAWNNRGIAAANVGYWALAEQSFERSITLNDSLEPHMGLANMFCTLMQLDKAATEYARAIELGAGPDARFNLGVTLLGMGQWTEGFKEYEHRWQNTPYPPRAYRDYPKWKGESLTGKRILLYPEQGYGDEILALRFANEIVARHFNSYVVIESRAPMAQLAKFLEDPIIRAPNSGSYITSVPFNSAKDWHTDYSCPLLDVPMVLGMQPHEVRCGKYLRAPYNPIREIYDWHERIAKLPSGLNVGLCWSSGGHLNTAKAAQQSKSIHPQWLTPLKMPGVNLISLQKDFREAVPDELGLHDWMDDCHDFADTAALIQELDLVISVDTSVAHLAGALGKPVWNFVRYSGYWPWLTAEAAGGPEHSIWYESMRLIRQPSLANWDEPIKRATTWLKEKVNHGAESCTV